MDGREVSADFDREWDGQRLSYIPPAQLRIAPSLALHLDEADELDPVNYQVIRSRLWNTNLDHMETIKRVSGSPMLAYGDDLNAAILTEDGETVVCGPSLQYFTAMSDLAVKWTLEYRSWEPGISEGDIFLQNDPWICAPHQHDTSVYAPIFWEGKLFCWVFSQAHYSDVGGCDAGSFCVHASDIFADPPVFPPIKLAREWRVQEDIIHLFSRQSRTPELVALQMRGQVAGIRQARNSLLDVIGKFGARGVKSAMRETIRRSSRVIGERLEKVPDGRWAQIVYTGGIGELDRSSHRLVAEISKKGGKLICTNRGSEGQWGPGNGTYSSWRSLLVAAVSAIFASDQLSCTAAVLEHMAFEPQHSTGTVADWPAATSSTFYLNPSLSLSILAVSRMALSDQGGFGKRRAMGAGCLSNKSFVVVSGVNHAGRVVASATTESMLGGMAAGVGRDGIDTGAAWVAPHAGSGNVEDWESALPVLYLYRRQKRDGGGAGQYWGGTSAELAIVGHKGTDVRIQVMTADGSINACLGLSGGEPGHAGNARYKAASGIREVLRGGRVPRSDGDLKELLGDLDRAVPASVQRLDEDDVFVISYCGGGGLGDPLDRLPESVARDVSIGLVSPRVARDRCGVVLTDDCEVDVQQTSSARAELRARRRINSVALSSVEAFPCTITGAAKLFDATPNLSVVEAADRRYVACGSCNTVLADESSNYKLATRVSVRALHEHDPEIYPSVSDFCDDDVVARFYYCPTCLVQLGVDVCRQDDPISADFQII
jgi:N-methylhydantoinase B